MPLGLIVMYAETGYETLQVFKLKHVMTKILLQEMDAIVLAKLLSMDIHVLLDRQKIFAPLIVMTDT